MRLLEISLSVIVLVLFLPAGLLIAGLIKLTSSGPVFFRPWRVGRNEVLFRQIKFRTMIAEAEKIGPSVTGRDDSRVTRIGRLLRRTKVDEIPQLINVLKGEMSLVGPRPEAPRYVEHYTPKQKQLLRVRPGVTSPASIIYRHEEQYLGTEEWEEFYISKLLPAKLELELEYLSMRNFWKDLRVLVQTGKALFVRFPGTGGTASGPPGTAAQTWKRMNCDV